MSTADGAAPSDAPSGVPSAAGRVLFLDPIGGIAGDMFLAAAVDLGVDPEALTRGLSGLGVAGWRLESSRSERHAIVGTHVEVVLEEPEHHPHRSLAEIERIIQAATGLSERVRARAVAIFRTLGEAEAKVHDIPVERVHFHEVGAVDAIVDICGASLVLELLGEPDVISAPPPAGGGTTQGAHGTIPLPAPATLEILRGVPIRFEGQGERTTPTGAAILKTVARFGAPGELRVERVGYGVGTADWKDRPNVLRAALGRREVAGDAIVMLEVTLDDCNPQLIGLTLEKLRAQGALDAHVTPALLRKSRPGHVLSVLAPEPSREALTRVLLTETTSLGVRWHPVQRRTLERWHLEVETPYGAVRMKLGLLDGAVVNAQPELEDCVRVSERAGVAVKQVLAAATAAWGVRTVLSERDERAKMPID